MCFYFQCADPMNTLNQMSTILGCVALCVSFLFTKLSDYKISRPHVAVPDRHFLPAIFCCVAIGPTALFSGRIQVVRDAHQVSLKSCARVCGRARL